MARRRDDSPFGRYRDDFPEREFEERVEARRKRTVKSPKSPPDPRKAPGRSEQNRGEHNKAPLLLRILAWGGVILLCFVAGFIGTSRMLKMLESQSLLKTDDRGRNRQELSAALGSERSGAQLDMQKVTLSLFYPKNDALAEQRAEIISRTSEENIQDAIHKLLELSGFFSDETRLRHVFRNVDTVYLDFSGPFISALGAVGAKPSTLFITGVVRTLRDNFPPITKVRFLVDSRITSTGAPVDLTATWQLPRQ
ncbi:MAG: GerMN domain-containing protein [Synergistaceae bacterium]|nr:GerMN domain-containing protein [Synergistaceae bacterium]